MRSLWSRVRFGCLGIGICCIVAILRELAMFSRGKSSAGGAYYYWLLSHASVESARTFLTIITAETMYFNATITNATIYN
jgi:hypothetical protein